MTARLPWLLAVLLGLLCAAHARTLVRSGPGFATMPIFVPVSLEYERQMRAARGQPAGRGGEEAVALARALAEEPELGAELAPRVEAMRATRERLLDARGRRHALNVALMDVGVSVASELTAEQWDRIHMERDALRARTEREVFDRLRERLR